MCPSNIALAESTTGSLWSSESANTVYKAVIEPSFFTPLPLIYIKDGIRDITDGG